MKVATLLGLLLVLSINTGAWAVDDDVMKQLVPTGKLRVGVAYAPAPTPIFVAKDTAGESRFSNAPGPSLGNVAVGRRTTTFNCWFRSHSGSLRCSILLTVLI